MAFLEGYCYFAYGVLSPAEPAMLRCPRGGRPLRRHPCGFHKEITFKKRFKLGYLPAALAVLAFPAVVSAADDGGNSCVSCHRTLHPNRLAMPVDDCRGGIHESKGVACSGCHGGDPSSTDRERAKSAGAGYVGIPSPAASARSLCGKCHKAEYDAWISSKHAPAAVCNVCHGAHKIAKASPDLISPARCSSCHAFPRANPLKTHILEARTAVLSVRARAEKLAGEGMDVKKTAEGLARLDERVAVMSHMADRAAIKTAAQKIRGDAARLGVELAQNEKSWRLRKKVTIGVAVVLFLGILTGAYIAIQRTRTRRMLGR